MGFDPASLAVMGLVAGAAGTGVSAVGQIAGGNAKAANAAYQSQVAANNAKVATQDATLEIQSGEVASFNQGLKTRAKVGAQKASQGAAGIDVNSGSAVDVRAGTEELGMLDALTMRSDASKRAYAKQVEASNDTAQSQLLTAESSQDVEAGELGAAGTLLSGASSVGGNWSKFQTLYGASGSASKAVGDATVGGLY